MAATSSNDIELTPAAFQVLLALAAGDGHGYGVMKFVEDLTGGVVRLPAGTLYRTIGRLVADGLVEETGEGDHSAPHDARRRYYRITPLGRQVAAQQAQLLERMVTVADQIGLLQERSTR